MKRRAQITVPIERLKRTNGEEECEVLTVRHDVQREMVAFVITSDHFLIPSVPEGQELPYINWMLDGDWRLTVDTDYKWAG